MPNPTPQSSSLHKTGWPKSQSSSSSCSQKKTLKNENKNSKKSPSTRKVRLSSKSLEKGMILLLLPDKECGFLREDGARNGAKGEFHKDLYFRFGAVDTGLMILNLGDWLEYITNEDPENPKVVFARLLCCAPRTSHTMVSYLKTVVDKCRENPGLVLREITKCPAGLLLALAEPRPALEMVLAISELVYTLSQWQEAHLYSSRLKDFFRLFEGSAYLTSKDALRKFLPHATPMTIQTLVFTLLEHFPRLLTPMLPLIHELAQCKAEDFSVPSPTRSTSFIVSDHDSSHHACRNMGFLLNVLKVVANVAVVESLNVGWEKMPLLPMDSELTKNGTVHGATATHSDMQLPVIRINEGYGSPETYLDTYFRLLREDCFSCLKKGISAFRAGELDERDMRVWINANPIGIVFRETLPGFIIALECRLLGGENEYKDVVLPMSGSLLCICDDGCDFQTPIWAIVLASEKAEEKKAILSIEVVEGIDSASNKDAEAFLVGRVLRGTDMLIAESPTYYKAYKPVLKALQKLDPQSIPFKDELVHLQTPPRTAPTYLNSVTTLNWRCIFTKQDKGHEEIRGGVSDFHWLQRQGYETTLDRSQIEAIEHALSNRLSLIQGPPGTGKTFLGVKILELLLSASTLPCGPILVVTYKNQSLDQFLEACLKFCTEPGNLVRVGGGGKSEVLKNTNLNRFVRRADDFSSDWRDNGRKLEQLQTQMEQLLEHLYGCKYFSMNAIISHAPERLLHFFLSRREDDRKLLKSLPEGMLISRSLWDGFPAGYEDVSKQLRTALHESLKSWIPQPSVFRLVQNCLATRGSSEGFNQPLIWMPSANECDEPEQGRPFDQEQEYKERSRDWQDMLHESFTGSASKGETNSVHNKIIHFKNKPQDLLLPNFQLFYIDVPKFEWLLQADPWKLTPELRCILIVVLMHKSIEAASSQLSVLKERYDCICQDDDEIMKRRRIAVLESAKIVGMTTTGAALHQDILKTLSPSIIVVEEAAEILEAQLLALLGPSVQHCILIGDHQQLRPSVASYELECWHNLGISMFERIAESTTIPYKSLSLQCRMRHEFLPMLRPIYPHLKSNMELVSGGRNQPPSCMKRSMFFWSHCHDETVQRSFANEGEARMVVALVKWLVAQGHNSKEITVLGAYNGQVILLREKLKYVQEISEVDVHTIDKFQGSENQIVIVSLVRSNTEGRIGHLKSRNRLCVAVSRARSAVYLCGNETTLIRKSPEWNTLVQFFKTESCFGKCIPLQCPRHPQASTFVIDSEHAESFSPKLCKKPCPGLLDCGHLCPETCHGGEHPKCKVEFQYTCGKCAQKLTRLCTENERENGCHNMVSIRLAGCGHMKECRCWENQARSHFALKCDQLCGKILHCGHPCSRLCSEMCTSAPCKICADIQREIAKRELQEKYDEIERQMKKIEANIEEGLLIEEIKEDGENADEYHWVKDRTEKYIQPTHDIFPHVTKIEKIRNLKLQKLCLMAQRDLINPTKPSQHLFHGTDDAGIQGIAKNGFMLPAKNQNNMFGRGCYFATDSSKSAQSLYTKGSNKLLLCELFLGQTWRLQTANPLLNKETVKKKGYDSVYSVRNSQGTGGTAYDEYVIYNPHQAIPRYIIHYLNEDSNTPKYSDLQKHATGVFTRTPLKPSRNFSGDLWAEYHFRLAESQFFRMANSKTKKVDMVEVIYNAVLDKKYKAMKECLANQKSPTEEMLVFHGTTKANIEKIIKEGFKIGGTEGVPIRCGAAHGNGVYTAIDPEISIPYSGDTGMMLLSMLLPGKRGVNHKNGAENVIVVHDVNQLLPLYVVHFS